MVRIPWEVGALLGGLLGLLCLVLGLLLMSGLAWAFWRREGAGAPPEGRASPPPGASQVPAAPPLSGVEGMSRLYAELLGYADLPAPAGGTHKVRRVAGLELHHETFVEAQGTGTAMEQRWWTPGPAALRVHVVERRLAEGLRRGLADLGMGRSRSWSPRWPSAWSTGDAALDARFRVYAATEQEARALREPALRAALLAPPHVDLRCDEERLVLEDPFHEGLLARMGGPMGMGRLLTPSGIEAQRLLHEQVAAVLVALRGAGSAAEEGGARAL